MARHSLRTRLVVLCVVLIAGAIAATAAIVSLSTTASIHQQYRQDIAGDAAVYDGLLNYAATHSSWTSMTSARLRKLDRKAGRITITDQKRHVLATSGKATEAPAHNAQPAAIIDPLAPDPTLSHSPQQRGIDARAQGPFRLTTAERKSLDDAATKMAGCLVKLGYTGIRIAHYPNGRAYVLQDGSPTKLTLDTTGCLSPVMVPVTPDASDGTLPSWTATPPYRQSVPNSVRITTLPVQLATATARESKAARQLTTLFQSCLRNIGQELPTGYPAVDRVDFLPALTQLSMNTSAETCLANARRTQLAGYVAPPVLLFLSGTVATHLRPGLSTAAINRIIVAATIILLIAVAAVVFAANGVSRPLRRLTGAVVGLHGGRPLHVSASSTKEVAALTDAFNDMSAELAVADSQRKEMTSDIAHELRTPLANIRGWLEAAHDGLATPDRPFIDSLLDESRLLQSIIDDLQVLAMADAGRLVIEPEPTDLGAVLDQVVAAQRPAAAGKQLRLELARHGDLTCQGSPERLRQAIGNLLANAIRYTDQGSVTITADGAPNEIVVDVTDTGRGIKAEDLPHIFDRFWRSDKSRDRRAGGSGLGLSIADQLVAAHGGRIDVYSTLGKGTTARVHLPRQPR